jgi:putative membrane protein
MVSALIGIILVGLIGGLVIWIVSKLNLGLTVDGFGTAFIASFVIAIISGVLAWLFGIFGLTFGGGLLGGIVNLVVAAVVLILAGGLMPGVQVAGFTGAIVAAISIGVVAWIIDLILQTLSLA